MPAVPSTAKTLGLDFARLSPAGTDWETFTFPSWVTKVAIRSTAGDVYVSRVASGAFAAAGDNYLTIPENNQWIAELQPGGGRFPSITSLQLAHASGAAGVIEFELLT